MIFLRFVFTIQIHIDMDIDTNMILRRTSRPYRFNVRWDDQQYKKGMSTNGTVGQDLAACIVHNLPHQN